MNDYIDDEYEEERSVGLLLGLGIFLLPIFFVWLTLRRGHTIKARLVGFGWLILVLFVSFAPKNNEPITNPTLPAQKQTATAEPVQNSTPKQIDIADKAFTTYTKDAFPKLYAQYGDGGLQAITEHDANAGFMVAGLPECDRVEYVGYSPERTNYPTNIVSFVDCTNGKRFYVSHGQILEITNTR